MSTTARAPLPSAWAAVRDGQALAVDLRSGVEFAGGHSPGALSLPYSARRLGERLAAFAGQGSRLLLVASRRDLPGARRQLGEAGFGIVGSMISLDGWTAAGLPLESTPIVDPTAPDRDWRRSWPTLIDVREPLEWDTGHIPGALLIPLGELGSQTGSLDREEAVAVICEAGIRSSTGASLLQREGFRRVGNVVAGTAGYRHAGLPLVFPAGA